MRFRKPLAAALCLGLSLGSPRATTPGDIVTHLFPHKDGEAKYNTGGNANAFIEVGRNGTVGWITYVTGGTDLTQTTGASLTLYISKVWNPGTLKVFGLTQPLTLPEMNVEGSNLAYNPAAPLASASIAVADEEKVLRLSLGNLLNQGPFYGVVLESANGLKVDIASKESAVQPLIELHYAFATADQVQQAIDAGLAAQQAAAAAQQSATQAGAAADAAGVAANAAQGYSVLAGQSATAAAGSAATAGQSATAAAGSATQSATSATAAAGSATQSATSATSAGQAATQASNSATAAGQSAAQASGSAGEAATSAGAAGAAATQAATSATAAGASATQASNAATAAAGSATQSAASAGEAAGSAHDAGLSAAAAGSSAAGAAASATQSAGSATAAGQAATAAAGSATQSATSATAAAASAHDATVASDASNSAAGQATTAAGAATTAAGQASASAAQAATAAGASGASASEAAGYATAAGASAGSCSSNAGASAGSAAAAAGSAGAAATSADAAAAAASAAASGGNLPSGTVLLTNSAVPPAGFSSTGIRVVYDNPWSPSVASSQGRYDVAGAVLDGKLYSTGGYNGGSHVNNVQSFDPSNGAWTNLTGMPIVNHLHCLVAAQGALYMIAGLSPTGSVFRALYRYNVAANNWTTDFPSVPTGRYNATAQYYNGKIYLIGGYAASPASNMVAATEVYDIASNTWSTKASLPTLRGDAMSALVNGKIYVMGGYNGSVWLNTCEAYDPATDTWTTMAPLPGVRASSGVAVDGDRIYLLGGGTSAGALNTVLQYDTQANSWITLANTLPTARQNGASGLINGKIYYTQGYGGGVLSSTDAYAVPKTVYLSQKP